MTIEAIHNTNEAIHNTKTLTPAELAKHFIRRWRIPRQGGGRVLADQDLQTAYCERVYSLDEHQAHLAGSLRSEAIVCYAAKLYDQARDKLVSSYLIIWGGSPVEFNPEEVANVELSLLGYQDAMRNYILGNPIPKDGQISPELGDLKKNLTDAHTLLLSKTLGLGIKGLGEAGPIYQAGIDQAEAYYECCLAEAISIIYHKQASSDDSGDHWEAAREYVLDFYDVINALVIKTEGTFTQLSEGKERPKDLAGFLVGSWRALYEENPNLFIDFLTNHCRLLYELDAGSAYILANLYYSAINHYLDDDVIGAEGKLKEYYFMIAYNANLKLDHEEVALAEILLWSEKNTNLLAYGTTYTYAMIFSLTMESLHQAREYVAGAINERHLAERLNISDAERRTHWEKAKQMLTAFYLEFMWATHKSPQPAAPRG